MLDLSSKPMVEILLATYNGEAHLEEQIDSLLSQEFRDWRLLVRDDGSDDKTVEILQSYRSRFGEKIAILPSRGVNLGPSGNFSELIRKSDAPYLMLCDQDDVWLPGKIGLTLGLMRKMESEYGEDAPLLVHTDFRVVDENLHVVADSGWRYQKTDPNRGGALNRLIVQNVATGCTVMINRPLRDLALPVPPQIIMHDWWLALVGVAFGRIGYLPDAQLLYRQHGVNAVGAKHWSAASFLKQLRSTAEVRGVLLQTQRQAGAFLERFDDTLRPEDRQMLQVFSLLGEKGFFWKRYFLLRYGFFHAGLLRKLGMFLFC